METIEERIGLCSHCLNDTDRYCHKECSLYSKYQGATEQKTIDHSEEHLNWIIKQHYLWSYEMCHCDNNECCTFKEWIDKAIKE